MSDNTTQPNTPDQKELAKRQALFQGMVYNEEGVLAEVAYVGGVAHYKIDDQGFARHIEAYLIDDPVLAEIKDQITSMQDMVVQQMMQYMGKEDIFTKAAIDASIRNMEQGVRQSGQGEWQQMLAMMGFRIIVDVHGEIVELRYPQQQMGDDDE